MLEIINNYREVLLVALVAILLPVILKPVIDRWAKSLSIALWVMLLCLYAIAEYATREAGVYPRMVCLCMLLLSGMKCITYRAWVERYENQLPLMRWLGFAWLWFGMNVQPWRANASCKIAELTWCKSALTGLACLISGLFGMVVCYQLDVTYVLPLFVVLSLSFHYGCLRLLTAWWRFWGIPVRLLFRNPLVLKGFRDFWSQRWNIGYSQMMATTVQRPLEAKLGRKNSVFAVFIISGLLHELAISVPAQTGYGLPFLVFFVHGVAMLIELKFPAFKGFRWLCLVLLIVGMPYLFPQGFSDAVLFTSVELVGQLITSLFTI